MIKPLHEPIKIIISSDLDGTLLDHHTYQWRAAQPAIKRLKALAIPIILNTSKTFAETKDIAQQIGACGAIICENGSAMFIKKEQVEYFLPQIKTASLTSSGDYYCIEFGINRAEILKKIDLLRNESLWSFKGFNDWTLDEIIEHTQLDKKAADLASRKQFSEPFLWFDSKENLEIFKKIMHTHGFKVLKGGRFFHVQGQTDKAKPLNYLLNHSKRSYTTKLIALGDNDNDIAMLDIADYPICIKSPNSYYPALRKNKNDIIYTQEEGPVGWNTAINNLLDTLDL